jgi:hypothetical protein
MRSPTNFRKTPIEDVSTIGRAFERRIRELLAEAEPRLDLSSKAAIDDLLPNQTSHAVTRETGHQVNHSKLPQQAAAKVG